MAASAVRLRGRVVLPLAAVVLLLAGTAGARAASCSLTAPLSTWSLGSSSDWNTAGNWSPNGVPNSSSQNVCIVDGTSTVTLDTSVNIASLQLATGNGLSIDLGQSLNVFGPQLINDGTITVNGGSGNNTVLQFAGSTTLSGTGTVQMNVTAAGGGNDFIQQSTGGVTLTNSGNTIQGAGIIGNGGLTVVNEATIDANASTQTLTLNGSGGVTNTGLLEATGGGTLQISTGIDNTGGTITANGGTVNNSNSITGGTLTSTSGSTLQSAGTGTLTNVTISTGSTYTNATGNTTNIGGSIVNQGTLALAAGSGANGVLGLNSSTTLSGGGTVQMSVVAAGGGNAFIIQNTGGVTLTNTDNTIEGTGIIGNGGLTFVNNATVDANASGQTLTLNGSGGVTNTATLEATGGGTLQISTGITNTGGTIEADGGTVNISNSITGGTLTSTAALGTLLQSAGTGTLTNVTISTGSTYTNATGNTTDISGSIVNQGTLALAGGDGANGVLGLNSSSTLSGGGTVQMSVNPTSGGNAFILQNTGGVTLTNTDNTIEGTGVIGDGALALDNQTSGTLNANAAGQTLLLNGSGNVVNQGLMQASNTGTLQINNLVNNAGGTITADNGTVLLTNSSTIQAGTLTTSDGGTIQGQSVTLDGRSIADGGQGTLTTSGSYVIPTGGTTDVEGTIANSGTIALNGGDGNNGALQLIDNTTLSGGGTVQMSVNPTNGGSAFILQGSSGLTLTNSNNIIEGTGIIGDGGLTFVNNATVNANASGQTLTLNGSGGVTNTATLEATGGGTLNIQTGITNTDGTITANGGTVNNFNTITGGTLTSTGASTFQSAGVGTLTNVTISSGSTYLTATGNTTDLNGSIVNQGTLALGGGDGNDGFLNLTSDTTLSGGGTVQMSVAAGSGSAFIEQGTSGLTLTNTDNTIEGAGVIGNGGLTFVNNATVNANASGQTLTLNGSGGVTNTATLEATGGGTLQISTGIDNTGGTIEANGGTVDNSNSITGGTLTSTGTSLLQSAGTGTLTNLTISSGSTYTTATGNTTDLNGSIVNQGTLALSGGDGSDGFLSLNSNTTLSGGGTVQMTVNPTSGGNAFIQQNTGGLTLTNTDNTIEGTGVIGNGGLTFVNGALGTVNSNAGGTLSLNGSGGVTNNGTFIASNDSTLSVTADLTNFSGGTLTGGIYESIDGGDGATLALANGPITTDAATITLSGPNSVFTANGTPLDSSLTTIATGGVFTITNGRNFTVPTGGLSNSGTVNVGAATGASSTLTAPQGINGTAGTLQINPTGNVVLGATSTTGFLLQNGSAAGSLALGSNNITVSSDYNNANFGVGNAFNNHANVSGSGLILAGGNVGMTVTGDGITGGSPATLDLGNVHVDTSGTGTFDINNTGTVGPVLRGAVQNSGISNPAFQITAQNFGPISLGGSTAINYTFNPTVAGSLSGQSFKVVSNFDNVAPITVNVTGAAYDLASPTVTSSLSPSYNFGVVQVGQSYTDQLTITNTLVASSAAFQEGLNASFGTTSNSQLTTNGGTITNLAAGTSNSTAMSVTLKPVTAGTTSGTVAVNFASNGATTSDLGITPLAGQTLDYSWTLTAINEANPSITPTTINFGNVRIDTTQQQALSVTNVAGTPPQASLDAQISATSGAATSNSGTINQLAAGGNNSTSLVAGLSTTTAGVQSGVATVALQSDATPEGCTSDCIVDLPSQTINVSGTVYRLANPVLNTTSLTLAARVGGPSPSQALSITNSSPDQYTEALNASFGSVSSPFSGSGTISGLAAQGTDASSLTIGLSTATSGTFSGTAAVNLVSTGAGTDNAPDLSLGAQSVSLTGKVYQTAVAAVTTSVNFGIVHVGDVVADQAVTVSNTASGALVDVITGGFTTPPPGSPFSASGNLGAGVAAGTSSDALQVGLNTSTAGVFSSTANLGLNSHDPDLPDVALSTGPVSLEAQVNLYAALAFQKVGGQGTLSGGGSSYDLNFGDVLQGSPTQEGLLALLNDNPLVDQAFTDLLSSTGTILSGSGFDVVGCSADDLAGGESQSGCDISLNTSMLGSFSELLSFDVESSNSSGYDEVIGTVTLKLSGDIVGRSPVPEPGSLAMLATALIGLAGFGRRRGRGARGE